MQLGCEAGNQTPEGLDPCHEIKDGHQCLRILNFLLAVRFEFPLDNGRSGESAAAFLFLPGSLSDLFSIAIDASRLRQFSPFSALVARRVSRTRTPASLLANSILCF